MDDTGRRIYEFGPFRLDAGERLLLRGGQSEPLTLQPKEFDLLLFLVRRGARVADRDEILKEVWGDAFVVPGRVDSTVSDLRKLLGDQPRGSAYIETVTKRGYRFIADVREVVEEPVAVVERTRARISFREDSAGRPADEPESDALTPGGLPPAHALPPAAAPRRKLGPPAAVLACAAAGALALVLYLALRPAPSVPANSIAVLPFRPLAGAGSDPALELGITDALITKLGNIRHVVVRPTSSVLRYSGGDFDPRAAGGELRVEAVLDGRVQREGDRIRLSVQFVRTADGSTLWADTFDGRFTDIFALQDEVSGRVASALALRLRGAEREGMAKRHTADAEAYQLYVQGRYFWNKRTKDDLLRSADYFRQAIARDPSYALAHAGLADSLYVLGWARHLPPEEAFPQAKAAALKALSLDPNLAEARTSLARLLSVHERDAAGSEREFRRAIESNPNYPTARHWYSRLLMEEGRVEEALAEARRARELDPLSLVINTSLAEIAYYARRYDEALTHFQKARELDRDFRKDFVASFHYFIYVRKGMYEEAAAEYARALAATVGPEGEARIAAALREAYRASGPDGLFRKQVELLLSEARRDPNFSIHMAEAHARLGDRERALEWLGRAVDEHHPAIHFLHLDPDFESLRADPRFAELMRRAARP